MNDGEQQRPVARIDNPDFFCLQNSTQPDLFVFDRFPDQPTATPLPTVTPSEPTATATISPPAQSRLYLPVIQ